MKNKLFSVLTYLSVPFYTLFSPINTYANIPSYAKLANILGPNNLSIRIGNQLSPADLGTKIRRYQDSLLMPGDGRTFGNLEFFNDGDKSMGLGVQTSTKNKLITLYYFPCTLLDGDTTIIEWANQTGGKRGCEEGIRVTPGNRPSASDFDEATEARLKQNLRRGLQYYCTVFDGNGRSWLNITVSGNPCSQPMTECQANGGQDCRTVVLDNYRMRDRDLTGIIACGEDKEYEVKSTGAKLKEKVNQIWQQAQIEGDTACKLRVLGQKDVIVQPLPTGERTIIEIRNTDQGLVTSVYQGGATVRSAKRPEAVMIQPGYRYTYSNAIAEDPLEPFDKSKESLELQVYLAKERGLEFCDRQQASGGQEGDKRRIILTATEGELKVAYEMFSVPDRLQIIYEGQDLIDTGFVSGRDEIAVPFGGDSAIVDVILSGNQDISSTRWNYTITCPQ